MAVSYSATVSTASASATQCAMSHNSSGDANGADGAGGSGSGLDSSPEILREAPQSASASASVSPALVPSDIEDLSAIAVVKKEAPDDSAGADTGGDLSCSGAEASANAPGGTSSGVGVGSVDDIDILEVPVHILSEDEDVGDGSGAAKTAHLTPVGASSVTSSFLEGPPGHTPFPHLRASFSSSSAASASIPIPGSSSSMPPPVPFNSPDDGMLVEMLKAEAKKQERSIRQRLEDRSLLNLFKTPERRGPGGVPRPRKRLRDAMGDPGEEDIDKQPSRSYKILPFPSASVGLGPCSSSTPRSTTTTSGDPALLTREQRISPYSGAETMNERDLARRARISASVDVLRRVVPGADRLQERGDVYEATAKYILFLRKKVGDAHDKDFIREFLPY